MSQLQVLEVQQPRNRENRFRNLQFKVKKARTDFEDYDLKEQIGEGGYGRVRKAVHKPTGETVAVKVLKVDQCNPEQIEGIQREIQLQQKLLHENIAQIYEVVRKEKKIYIFMEFCPNGDLFDRIVKNGPMSEKQAVGVLHQILSGLLYLKKMGVSHRDIKPENIIFDNNWNAKIVDFGFSCTTNSLEDKMRTTVCGTPSYTPPQVLLKTTYSAELMDVWCLGATFFTMLAAENPFTGENEKKKSNIINCKWTPKSFFSQKVSRFLSSIFTQPSQRPNLQDLAYSELLTAYQFSQPNFIDYTKQIAIPQEPVLQQLQKQFDMNRKKVSDSIKLYQLDRNRAHYYIVLSRLLAQKKNLLGVAQLSKYKKQRKSSLSKLQPIIRTPLSFQKAQTPRIVSKKDYVRVRRPSIQVDSHTLRLKRQSTPQSPKKFIDCLESYR